MDGPRRKLSPATTDVLIALLKAGQRELYGLEIAKTARVATGSLYPILAMLTRWGWVEPRREMIDPSVEGRPQRTYYRLTQAGVAAAKGCAHAGGASLACKLVIGNPPRPTVAGRIMVVLLRSKRTEMYGLEVAKATGLDHAQIYPILAGLAKDGMVLTRRESSAPGSKYHPPRTYYRLSAVGAKAARRVAKVPASPQRVREQRERTVREMVVSAMLEAHPSEMYGLEIAEALGVNDTSVYTVLKGLAENGLVVPRRVRIVPSRGCVWRVYYRFTDAGLAVAQRPEPSGSTTARPAMEVATAQSKKPTATGEQVLEVLRSAVSEMCVSEIAAALGADRRRVNAVVLRLVKSSHLESRREDVNANDPRRPPRVFYRPTEAGVEATGEKAHRNLG